LSSVSSSHPRGIDRWQVEARVESLSRERPSTAVVEPSFGASFAALAEARFEFVQAKFRHPPNIVDEAEQRYDNTRRLFTSFHGGIIHEYWTSSAPGGVVVTASGRRWPFEASNAHFFRFTDYMTGRHPETGELLFAGDALASM